MTHPVDELKLRRVRERMAEEDLEALVVRAPDNVLYLTDYWCMKGFDIAVFPREGEPVLIVVEPQAEEAARGAWTEDVRSFAFYSPSDPRPPAARAIDLAVEVLTELDVGGRIGLELSQGTQGADRMVGEPTVFTQGFFDAFQGAAGATVDASPLLARVRAIKTEQEIGRMRLANELAALGVEHVRERLRPGMKESEVAAMFEAFVHAEGIGFRGEVEMARAFTLVWSGSGIATFTATHDRPVQEHEPTLLEIWVCADGYWTDLTKNLCPGTLTGAYDVLLEELLQIFDGAVASCRPGKSMAEIDLEIRQGIAAAGYPGQPSHPLGHGVGARAHEPPFMHQAGGGTCEPGMVLAIEPGIYWEGGGGLRLEDNFLVTDGAPQKLCRVPEDFR